MKIFPFLLVLFFLIPSFGKDAFLALVGTGAGNGILGHSFLVFKDSNQPYFVADAYQYNISRKDGRALAVDDVTRPEQLNFGLVKQMFVDLFSAYSSQNRMITLYGLNLTDVETNQLLGLLKQDFEDKNFSDRHPYGIYNNCVTRSIDLINAVVPESKKISILTQYDLMRNSKESILTGSLGAVLNRLPFVLASVLEKHPISLGRKQVYDGVWAQKAGLFSAARQDVDLMASNCSWNPEIKSIWERYTVLALKDSNQFQLEPMLKFANSCEVAKPHLKNWLLKIYRLIPESQNETRTKVYQWTSKLSEIK